MTKETLIIDSQQDHPRGGLHILWLILPYLVLVLFLVGLVLFGMALGKKKEQLAAAKAAEQEVVQVLVNSVLLEVHATPIEDTINLPGIIEPWTRLELMAKVGGTVEEVLVKEGDRLHQGQVVARIEDEDYRIALESAEAAYELARATLERDRAMFDKKVISPANLDVSETSMRTAKAKLDEAKLQLSRCAITAPMDGLINRLDAKIGLLLSVGDPIMELLKISQVKAVVGIPESDVDAVRRLDSAEIQVQALGDRTFVGRTDFLAPAPLNTAHLYRLELAIDNPNATLLPGMFFRTQLVKQRVEEAMVIPIYAVITRGEEQFVFVVKDGKVEKRPVTLGIIDGWLVQVTTGLKEGDQVMVEGHRDVEAGQQVNVIKVLTDPHGPVL